MPLLGKYKQGDLGKEDETKLSRGKLEAWSKASVSHGSKSTVKEASLSGKNQTDSNFDALADKKDY